ncbi:hypothetical protein COCOR_05107 [Corallococcus coralloides DSM 2259]|uniref:Thioesterase n=1 Tax=Corallococcus coralloides (strain ATCC 25202 / DSM 2259 / NBRC 100086 / M2) TaxID=1144275 RepID=H8MRC6_CORCM|nr:thioesterase family protein [Corallococcus coralloides]AFE06195.1 hypothetical protein COCOR_05107 [Corallococcus coralloides DSM 2259]
MEPYSRIIEVRWADVDANQHLRHSAYSDYATHVRLEWLNEQGFSARKMAELQVFPVIFSDGTEYIKEVRLSDRIRIELEMVGLSADASRYHFRQRFLRGETLCARYELRGAWLNVAERKLGAPPQGMVDAARLLKRADDFEEIPLLQKKDQAPPSDTSTSR